MSYVIGVDLGTSGVKTLLFKSDGSLIGEASAPLSVYHDHDGYSEQEPDDWYNAAVSALADLNQRFPDAVGQTAGLSFSGQMHGLVLLDKDNKPLRRAILWNDTRTTTECQQINDRVGEKTLLDIAKNKALEGFTLPKLLWVKNNEPDLYSEAQSFVLPKDYLRYKMTGRLEMEYSDAAGTLLLDVAKQKWSTKIAEASGVAVSLLPQLTSPTAETGQINSETADKTGLNERISVFAGGADNACGAVGSGVINDGKTMCSIGTSGVILSHESNRTNDTDGTLHYFNHGVPGDCYTMGVTLAAGYSLDWFKQTFCTEESFETVMDKIAEKPVGANGLIFTPYLVGERTPYPDAAIRSSFIGVDASHDKWDFARAVVEGITFSLRDSLELIQKSGKQIDEIVSIGGGAKSDTWLTIQANIFQSRIVSLESEQGPGQGAAMIAAVGTGACRDFTEAAEAFVKPKTTVYPSESSAKQYEELYNIYQSVYERTAPITRALQSFR
ncbi:xylulokinase [Salisediminibacterium halotolerans]|uniref:Xylulose kinase n=1 Tax=Salisediminibacterium halotolerans TaxID=517425 RepID=A0A1H9WJF1_9BACI|nr:xylulokinase [Salisediminibacterium haloalkalitolerans]SES34066.1 xylulokinase [Salisediminibacterium haloalkalitolerans]